MKKKTLILTSLLLCILVVSILVGLKPLETAPPIPEFYVGVEMAYSNARQGDIQILVDKVKNYTNLFVIGSPEISINETSLNEACEYIYASGLSFIILFTREEMYTTYDPFSWMLEAKKKYGEKFLGVYRYDEPGGNQLDQGREMLIKNATGFSDASTQYTEVLGSIVGYYLNYSDQIFTSDYGLYWFDYKSKYSTVFAEFGSNHSREINIASCRGAAKAFNKNWGTIITWTYNTWPYIESPEELYRDMILAYNNGAKYVIIFNYPKNSTYGILTEEHFDILQRFWNYSRSRPQDFAKTKARAVYVLPQDYGFGLRRADDRIWGLFDPDHLSEKTWNDANKLAALYGSSWDIVYDEPGAIDIVRKNYDEIILWNETIK